MHLQNHNGVSIIHVTFSDCLKLLLGGCMAAPGILVKRWKPDTRFILPEVCLRQRSRDEAVSRRAVRAATLAGKSIGILDAGGQPVTGERKIKPASTNETKWFGRHK